jgi:hypothetical protein
MAIIVDPGAGHLKITLAGEWPSVREQQDVTRRLLEAGQISRTTPTVIDIRGVSQLPNFAAIEATLAAAEREIDALPLHVAYVVSPGANFGIGRMLQSMAPAGLVVEIFTDEPSAVEWVTAQQR